MKKEEKDESNERLIKAGRFDWQSLFPANRLLVVQNDPKTKECASANKEAPEYLTATYWG